MPIKIKFAKKYGYCFGVERAVKGIARLKGRAVTLGPIIHNPQFVNKLKKRGIKSVSDVNKVKNATLVIRAHGVSDKIFKQARERNLKVVDLTCPYVKKMQSFAKLLEREGYKVIIIGSKRHPEIKAISSDLKSPLIFSDANDVKNLNMNMKAGIICQTTSEIENINKIIKIIKKSVKEVKVLDTICEATKLRQAAAKELARQVDLMIVIGGRKSSNTRKLASVSSEIVSTHHIEDKEELKKVWFKNIKTVGITAGASTPDWVIKNVYKKIKIIS